MVSFELLEHAYRAGMEEAAGLGQRQRPGLAVEQLEAEFLLELLDLPAQRWLRDIEPFGRPGEAALLRHCDEILEVPKIHRDTF